MSTLLVYHYGLAFFFDGSFFLFVDASYHATVWDILAELVSDFGLDGVKTCIMNIASRHAWCHLWDETSR